MSRQVRHVTPNCHTTPNQAMSCHGMKWIIWAFITLITIFLFLQATIADNTFNSNVRGAADQKAKAIAHSLENGALPNGVKSSPPPIGVGK